MAKFNFDLKDTEAVIKELVNDPRFYRFIATLLEIDWDCEWTLGLPIKLKLRVNKSAFNDSAEWKGRQVSINKDYATAIQQQALAA